VVKTLSYRVALEIIMNYRAVLFATIQTVGLFAAGLINIPVLGQVLILFTPVPLIIIYVRNNRREGLTALGASGTLILLLGGWQAAAILLFSFGLMAIGIAEGMRRKMKPEAASLLGGLLPIAVLGAIVLFYVVRVGKSPVSAVEEYLRESLTEAAGLYSRMGLAEMAATVTSVTDSVIYYLTRLMPGITVATSIAQAACCYGIARAFIARKPGSAASLDRQPFALWHAPDAWVWGLIAALAFIIVPQETPRFIGWNLAILFAVLYVAQGTAIVEHYLLKAHLKPFLRGLIITLLLAMPPTLASIIALGIVDIWADVRKVRVSGEKA
jgi:uncharacterized protein YybS (DUF2232 family)